MSVSRDSGIAVGVFCKWVCVSVDGVINGGMVSVVFVYCMGFFYSEFFGDILSLNVKLYR